MASAAALCASGIADAGLFRAYVSLNGNDANACTLQAPCRLLPAALTAINAGGEIWMLDSANFNTAPVENSVIRSSDTGIGATSDGGATLVSVTRNSISQNGTGGENFPLTALVFAL